MSVTGGGKHLVVNGTQFQIDNDHTYSVTPEKVESIVGARRVGRSVTGAACFIEVTVFLDEGVPSSALTSARNADVSLVLQDRTVTLSSDADYCGEGDTDGTKMSLKARFEAKSGREVF